MATPSYATRNRGVTRRILVVTDVDASAFLNRISTWNGPPIQVAAVITSIDNNLASLLTPEKLRRDDISEVILVGTDGKHLPKALLLHCRIQGIPVLNELSFWERDACRISIDGIDANWFLSDYGFYYSGRTALQKRILDLLVSTALLVLTLPLMLLVALLVRADSSGPAIYRQQRVGLDGRIFTLFKFRSMRADAELPGRPQWADQNDPRITRVGRWIRYTRIDELPQLLNVLRGDMSMIGPRPERPYFVDQLNSAIPLYNARHWVKPGITGWAQVKASYGASIEDAREKLEYELYYIKHRTLALDLLILLQTIKIILLQQGAR